MTIERTFWGAIGGMVIIALILAAILFLPLEDKQIEQPAFISNNGLPGPYAPGDHIGERQISVMGDKIIIDLQGRKASWSRYSDTNSMLQVFDAGHNGLEFVPEGPEDIRVGDIVAYERNGQLIVHRVREIHYNENGWCAIIQGDNNSSPDTGCIEFKYIKYVTFGIIY